MKNLRLLIWMYFLTGCCTVAKDVRGVESEPRDTGSRILTIAPGQEAVAPTGKTLKCLQIQGETCHLEYEGKQFWLTPTSRISPSSDLSVKMVSLKDKVVTIQVTKKKKPSLFWRLLGPPF